MEERITVVSVLPPNRRNIHYPERDKIKITFFSPVVFFTHLDSFGVSCWVLEISAIKMSAFSPRNVTKWHLLCGAQRIIKLHLKKLTPATHSRNHDIVSQDNPLTLLWAVPCRNYFLYSRIYQTTFYLLLKKVVPTWNRQGLWITLSNWVACC